MVIFCIQKLEKILKIRAKIEFSKVHQCEQFGFFKLERDFKELGGHFKIIKTHLNGPTRTSHITLPHLLFSLPEASLSPMQLPSLFPAKPNELSSSLCPLLTFTQLLSFSFPCSLFLGLSFSLFVMQ